MEPHTVGSLFSGIGGLDLGLERAGWSVRWQVETDPYCSRVLKKHWPDIPNLGDVTTIDWSTVEPVELICGGFPCQPVSLAGRQAGQDDERWLWPEFARCVRALRPRYVLVENVPGLLVRGMGDVLGDLAACGYDTEWDCIPAAAVGAPHLRYRVFIVALADTGRECLQSGRRRGVFLETKSTDAGEAQARPVSPPLGDDGEGGGAGTVADAERSRRTRRPTGKRSRRDATVRNETSDPVGDGRQQPDVADAAGERRRGSVFALPDTLDHGPESPHGDARTRGDESWWAVEPDVGRVAHGIPRRVDRLRALGNAVVPQVAEWIGHRLMEHQW